MLDNLSISYPYWYILLCLLLGLIYAVSLYRRDRSLSDISRNAIRGMGLLRFLSVTITSFLLLTPMLKSYEEEIKKPIILIAEDKSESIYADQEASFLQGYDLSMDRMVEQLSDKFEVKRVVFGADVKSFGTDTSYSKVTNISNVLNYVSDNYADQNLGAVILSTDGIYNEGKNPLYIPVHSSAPIYTIALGDTTVRKDLVVANVFYNKIAYLNDQFIIQVDVNADNADNNQSTLIVEEISNKGNRKLYDENFRIDSDDYFMSKEIKLTASRAGVIRYRISLNVISDEVTTANNVKDIFVEVLDARRKILILADGPHPDIAAMKDLITDNKNYEVSSAIAGDEINVQNYDLVILHNLPSEKNKVSNVLQELKNRKIPQFYVVGASTSLAAFNAAQSVVNAQGRSTLLENVQADIVQGFTDFTLSDELEKIIPTLPPLLAPFGEYSSLGSSNVLLTQNIKKVETKSPLLAYNISDGHPTAVLIGEGIWRWKLFNYLKNENFEVVKELINKSLQLIAKKEDKRKFRVNQSKNIYKENENILFDAQLYNTSYEMINDPDIIMKVYDAEGKQYDYSFTRSANYYTLNAGQLSPGNYTYTASVLYDGESLKDKGRFSVQNIQLELYDLTAKHGLLRNISRESGGTLYYPSQIEDLATSISNNDKIKPVSYQSSKTSTLLNYKWLFFLIFASLSIEWFLRRYLGL